MKRFPKILVVLLMVTVFLVPMFISCDGETAPPPDLVGEARTAFLGELKDEATYDDTNVAVVVNGANIEIELKDGANDLVILGAAKDIADALKGITVDGTYLTIDSENYYLHDDASLSNFKLAMDGIFKDGNGVVKPYTASIKYGGQTFSLAGTITVTDKRQPD